MKPQSSPDVCVPCFDCGGLSGVQMFRGKVMCSDCRADVVVLEILHGGLGMVGEQAEAPKPTRFKTAQMFMRNNGHRIVWPLISLFLLGWLYVIVWFSRWLLALWEGGPR